MHSDVQNANIDPLVHELALLVGACGWLCEALIAARDCIEAPWCIAAGAVRNLVWNHLHGFADVKPNDVDLVFFDPSLPSAEDKRLTTMLRQRVPGLNWEVVNQAHVHLWTSSASSAPFQSLTDAIKAWPETATAVGVALDTDGTLKVVAPLGLTDLFGLVLRPSPYVRNPEAFAARTAAKQFHRRWPKLRGST